METRASAGLTGTGTWTGQRLAGNPVTVSIKAGWVAAWAAVIEEVALGRGLVGEVAAVDIAGRVRALGTKTEQQEESNEEASEASKQADYAGQLGHLSRPHNERRP